MLVNGVFVILSEVDFLVYSVYMDDLYSLFIIWCFGFSFGVYIVRQFLKY